MFYDTICGATRIIRIITAEVRGWFRVEDGTRKTYVQTCFSGLFEEKKLLRPVRFDRANKLEYGKMLLSVWLVANSNINMDYETAVRINAWYNNKYTFTESH